MTEQSLTPAAEVGRRTFARFCVLDAGTVGFETSFHPRLIAALKRRIPASARRWDRGFRRWLVDAQYVTQCAELAEEFLGVRPAPPVEAPPASVEKRLVRLDYLGRCKERESGQSEANGWANGRWTLVFPESVLRAWFEPESGIGGGTIAAGAPNAAGAASAVGVLGAVTAESMAGALGAAGPVSGAGAAGVVERRSRGWRPTLYGALGLRASASLEEVKGAYRRLAKQWHPDVCAEPDAAERFRRLTEAYEVLRDVSQRRRYDAGLAFEAQARSYETLQSEAPGYAYSAPLRCGWVLCEGQPRLGQFEVANILQWEAVTDEWGREMVTSWPQGATHFVTQWVAP